MNINTKSKSVLTKFRNSREEAKENNINSESEGSDTQNT